MSRIDTHAFGLFWRLARGWFRMLHKEQTDTIIAAMPKEADESQIDNMFV